MLLLAAEYSHLITNWSLSFQLFVFPSLSSAPIEIEDMGVVQLQFSKTQKVRLHKAKESLSSKMNSDSLVTVADSIHVNREDGVLKGHGTADLDGQVVATLCGTVERVNKLIYVRGLGSR